MAVPLDIRNDIRATDTDGVPRACCRWGFLGRREDVVLMGNVGTGKTHIVSLLCNLACERREEVRSSHEAADQSRPRNISTFIRLNGPLRAVLLGERALRDSGRTMLSAAV